MKSPETGSSEQHKNEEIALKMQGVLDRVKQPQNHKALSEAGYDFANERYDAGQGVLEKNGFWHDTVREIDVEANRAEGNKKGNAPLNFSEAKTAINGYAKSLAESGVREDKKSATAIESIVLGTDRPGIEEIDEALKYIEGVLQTKARLEKHMTPEMKTQWDEQRAVRDALFAEKQRRVEAATNRDKRTPESRLSKEEIAELNKKDKVELEGLREMFGLNEKAPEKITAEDVRLKSGLPELNLKEGAKAYDRSQGSASIFEVFKQLNPDAQHLSEKIEHLRDRFGLVLAQEKKSNPGKSEEAYENFANNKIFGELEPGEKQAIEEFLDANYKKMGGSGQRLIAASGVFGDFIRFITKE